MNDVILKIVDMCLANLDDTELAAMAMKETLFPNSDHRNMPYYDKVSPLFREEYVPPKMHEDIREAFMLVAAAKI